MGEVNNLAKVISFFAARSRRLNPGKAFVISRLPPMIWGAALGAAGALCIRLFQSGIVASYFPKAATSLKEIGISFESDQVVQNSFLVLLAAAVLLLLPTLKKKLVPLFRSWRKGLVSFLCGAVFFATLTTILFPSRISVGFCFGLISLLFIVECALHRETGKQSQDTMGNDDDKWTRLFGPKGTDPISSFEDDLADRKSVVSTLSRLAMTRLEPIIALSGGWGSGKSSVLRLLQKDLESEAIVVQFNAWLPGTEAIFAKQLMGAIATECGKQYAVPGLERSLKTFAQLVAGTVKELEVLKPFFPIDSQQVEIERMITGINRIPKRIVVLIDEIDRMDSAEASVLLKILRGAPALSNISFVCAVHVKALEEKLKMKRHEIEKFLPLTINLRPPDPEILKRGLEVQFEKFVEDTFWFQKSPKGLSLSVQVSKVFDYSLRHQFTNFRTLRSLVGRFRQIEATILSEVNPLDMLLLVAIELRAPLVLEFIARKSQFLTDEWFESTNWPLSVDQQRKEELQKLYSIATAEDSPEIIQILCELFPILNEHCAKEEKGIFIVYRAKDPQTLRADRRVGFADFSWAYFRGFLREETLSNLEFDTFLSSFKGKTTFADRAGKLCSFAQSIESKLKLKDFWWRLARVKTFTQPFELWADLVRAIAGVSDLYHFDAVGMMLEAEPSHSVVIALWNAMDKIEHADAQSILSEVIENAPKDAFALQLMKDVIDKRAFDDVLVNLNLDPDKARQAFLHRMKSRYSDPTSSSTIPDSYLALTEWSKHSEEEKQACHAYFRELLSKSPGTFPSIIRVVYPRVSWTGNPRNLVERIFPLKELNEFILNYPLDALDEKAVSEVGRVKDLLEGKYP